LKASSLISLQRNTHHLLQLVAFQDVEVVSSLRFEAYALRFGLFVEVRDDGQDDVDAVLDRVAEVALERVEVRSTGPTNP
jgi:hypothetical protein